jgi:isoaspartyl peptidase/L-asparaginase-like protein (Ntn-hydrolase superfamily)
MKTRLRGHAAELPPFWRGPAWRQLWNYAQAPEDLDLRDEHADTVGVVVRDGAGRFAAALSSGGTSLMLRGRVGDVPIFGAGLYAGAHGAAAATGIGERIVERLLAHTVHGWLGAGVAAQEAAERAVASVAGDAAIGIVIVTASEIAAAADRAMAWAGRAAGGPWFGPGT